MNNSKPVNPCKVITGKDTRLSYEHVWEPASINGGNPKYSACVMWPKTDEVTTRKVNDAIAAAYREGESRLKGSGIYSVKRQSASICWKLNIRSRSGWLPARYGRAFFGVIIGASPRTKQS